ncbi:hypothetical protein J008_03754 [Cryptococcus neoformans]|nr:hypothetical protein J008_03754 [Cryptococcus neoformans var. grubii]
MSPLLSGDASKGKIAWAGRVALDQKLVEI